MFYRMKLSMENENKIYRMKVYFIEWKHIL